MKLCCGADWHLRATCPVNRIDKDYFETCKEKCDFIFNYMNENKIAYFLHAGDLLDIPIVPDRIKTYLTRNFKKYFSYMVLGQHSLTMRALIDNSSIAVMLEGGCLIRLGEKPLIMSNINIYGCSFNEEIPKILDKRNYNILVIHKMISDKDYWQGHVEYTSAKKFMTDHKFDLIISGDNHNTFTCRIKNRLLLNSGSLTRSRVDQKDHKPCFFVVDTDTQEFEQIFIPIKSAEEVFNFTDKDVKSNEDLDKFISEFESSGWVNTIDIKAKAMKLIDSEDIDDHTKMIILEIIKEVDERGEE